MPCRLRATDMSEEWHPERSDRRRASASTSTEARLDHVERCHSWGGRPPPSEAPPGWTARDSVATFFGPSVEFAREKAEFAATRHRRWFTG